MSMGNKEINPQITLYSSYTGSLIWHIHMNAAHSSYLYPLCCHDAYNVLYSRPWLFYPSLLVTVAATWKVGTKSYIRGKGLICLALYGIWNIRFNFILNLRYSDVKCMVNLENKLLVALFPCMLLLSMYHPHGSNICYQCITHGSSIYKQ